MKVLVTGGTGFLGKAVVRRLAAAGHELRLLARESSRLRGLPAGIEVRRGDVTDAAAFTSAAEGCDAILHMAALVKTWLPDSTQFDRVNMGGLTHALSAARAAGARLVYTSSFIAIGPTGETPADESKVHEGYRFRNDYERTKALADAEARRAIEFGQDVVILYPGVVYGPGELNEANLVVKMVRDHLAGRLPGIIGPGDRRWSYTFVDDVAAAHVAALEHGRTGERYFLGGDNATMNDFFAILESLSGRPAPRWHIPYSVASAMGYLLWMWAEQTGHAPEVTHREVAVFREHWAYASGKARAELGYQVTPLREGLRRTLDWLSTLPARRFAGGMSALSRGEILRKLTHIGVGGFAFFLRDLTWPQAAAMAAAAFVFNWQVFPRIGGKQVWRATDHDSGYPVGILLYPLSVVGLVLIFRHELWKAAAVWGVLALGDGIASLAGMAIGGPRLFWNPRKSWAGFVAMIVGGAVGATVLAAWTRAQAIDAPLLWLGLGVAVACAWAESVPTTLDDNLTVPLIGAIAIALLSQADLTRLEPGAGRRVLIGLGLNAVIALGAYAAHSIDVPGALSAVFIGTTIVAGLGLRAFALMMVFFVLGSTVTKIGYRIKAARGIAQEKGGARGWRNAWANGGVPAVIAGLGLLVAPKLVPLYVMAYAAAVATAAADTCSSEVGKAYGRRTFLITTFQPVPPGTEGAVSLEGTLAAVAGAAAVAFTGAALGLFGPGAAALVTLAGVVGSLVESVVGTIAEKRGWMNNDLLNAFNTAVGAGFMIVLVRIL